MPISKTKLKNAATAARSAALPKIPKELLDQFVSGPMTGEAVNTASMAFKKALIERALGAELGHHLSYPNGAIKPEAVSNSQCDPASLNTHVHFHVCVVDGVFEALPEGVAFHATTGLNAAVIAQVQANVSKRILRAFVARGHIEACDAKDMAAYAHGGGFSVDSGVRIESNRPTAQGWSNCCVTARGHHLRWSGSSSAALIWRPSQQSRSAGLV